MVTEYHWANTGNVLAQPRSRTDKTARMRLDVIFLSVFFIKENGVVFLSFSFIYTFVLFRIFSIIIAGKMGVKSLSFCTLHQMPEHTVKCRNSRREVWKGCGCVYT
jgi:hypothetical protein